MATTYTGNTAVEQAGAQLKQPSSIWDGFGITRDRLAKFVQACIKAQEFRGQTSADFMWRALNIVQMNQKFNNIKLN